MLGLQGTTLSALERQQQHTESAMQDATDRAEALLRSLNLTPPERAAPAVNRPPVLDPSAVSWDALVASARAAGRPPVTIGDLLSVTEISAVDHLLDTVRRDAVAGYRLDAADMALAGVAGVIGGIIDIVGVGLPPGVQALGTPAREGGPLGVWVRDLLGRALPEDRQRFLERAFKVPFDASINAGLGQPIPGLTPSTHRLHSPGHDPVLGFIVGVADLLRGTFTAIGQDGAVISQAAHPERVAATFIDALLRLTGHLLSDINTPAGLPSPLFTLTPLLQFGSFTRHGYTGAELARLMYRGGYDFRHFLASSIPVLIIEVIVRLGVLARRVHAGVTRTELRAGGHFRTLPSLLTVAHGMAAGMNAGKVYFMNSPLAISQPQWLAFGRYLLPELKLRLFDLPALQDAAGDVLIELNWRDLHARSAELWTARAGVYTLT